ncbi:MAG TPA: hypothetical protein VK473_02230 [Terriglobales bacterium]|nr:hypothetical protein [Terriglobales bacterium]
MANEVPTGSTDTHQVSVGPTRKERSVWIVTGYVAAALALLGVLAYHFSTYVLK